MGTEEQDIRVAMQLNPEKVESFLRESDDYDKKMSLKTHAEYLIYLGGVCKSGYFGDTGVQLSEYERTLLLTGFTHGHRTGRSDATIVERLKKGCEF